MADQAAREQLSETMKRIGHQPPPGPRVGSDGVPSDCEALLLATLTPDWKLHHRIARGTGRSFGRWAIPDLTLLAARIAIEVDGNNHRLTTQKAIDRRKEEFLLSRGFRVIRIPNENVEHALEDVVAFITAVAGRPAAAQEARPW